MLFRFFKSNKYCIIYIVGLVKENTKSEGNLKYVKVCRIDSETPCKYMYI